MDELDRHTYGCLPLTAEVPFRLPPEGPERASLLRDGLVRPVIGDVVTAPTTPDDDRLRALSARLLLPAGTHERWVVGFAAAAWVHTGYAATEAGPPAVLDVVVPPGRRRPQGPGLRGRQLLLEAADVVRQHGLLVTTPVRTAADVARELPGIEALAVLHHLHRVVGLRPPAVRRQLSRMRYSRGCRRAREVLRAWESCAWEVREPAP